MTTGPLGAEQLAERVARRLTRCWPTELIDASSFPWRIGLGRPTAQELHDGFGVELDSRVQALRRAASGWMIVLESQERTVSRHLGYSLPCTAVVDDLAAAGRVAGGDWALRIERARWVMDRLGLTGRVTSGVLTAAQAQRLLRELVDEPEAEVELLARAARWFTENGSTHQLTPRQVPVEGMHAKWLTDARCRQVRQLTGMTDLGLRQRPSLMEFSVPAPALRAAGWPPHLALVPGEPIRLPGIRTLVVCENRDSAHDLAGEQLPGVIAVAGDGDSVVRLAGLSWLDQLERVVYWGDIDEAGYRILSRLRQALQTATRPVHSVAMDEQARQRLGHLGTRTDRHGGELPVADATPPPLLEPEELEVWRVLADPTHQGHLRHEQERIPAPEAAGLIRQAIRRG